MMSAARRRSPLAAPVLTGKPAGPHWRALLEARWRERLQEVTELSLAYAASTPDGIGAPDGVDGCPGARSLLQRAVTARQKLADVEEALSRLTAGTFGHCEQCGSAIGRQRLSVLPEARYCARCAADPCPALRC
jgi:RNA polymerase-binding transcription factor DksA